VIDLKNIETFVWVAQLGGFGLAAQRLNTTQSAVSQRIEGLEHALGVRLLDRRPRRVAVNAKGRELLPYAEQMLRLRAEMIKAAGAGEAFRGHVRLGIAETLVHTVLIQLIEKMQATYPSITLDIEVDISKNLRDDLLKGNLDLAFLHGPVIESNVRNLDYARYRLTWVASPAVALPAGTVSLQEVAQFPIITYSKNTKPYLELRDKLRHLL
jgi:DNA-binding transcriptional LysR family regulator